VELAMEEQRKVPETLTKSRAEERYAVEVRKSRAWEEEEESVNRTKNLGGLDV
jgi:hypothetical protein